MLGSYDILFYPILTLVPMGLYLYRERSILELLSHLKDIAGKVINITIIITSENCADEKYNKSSLLRKLEEEVSILNN